MPIWYFSKILDFHIKNKIIWDLQLTQPKLGKFVLHILKLKKSPNILVSPLEWGIGHATRCVPVIQELLSQGANVIIGSDGRPQAFLKMEFPSLEFIKFPGYRFSYPSSGSMSLKMAIQAPTILNGIKLEKQALNRIIKDHKIDAVISDNRFGLYSKQVPSIFITHQLSIKVPGYLSFLKPLLFSLNKYYISRFNECWIPDFPNEPNLSGELSHIHYELPNTFFIGPLSRFSGNSSNKNPSSPVEHFRYDFLVLISGPEPQRTILEEKLLNQLKIHNYSALLLGGKPESNEVRSLGEKIIILSHLDTGRLRTAMNESRIVLSRPGYSTIMDLAVVGKKAIFIPTPGQTEQEYLARYCQNTAWFSYMNQSEIDLPKALKNAESYTGIQRETDPHILRERITKLIKSL
jgi:uncharacterized protein (TIGR00661 family)